MSDEPDGFGPALRAARESAGRTVEQVSAATRLRASVVQDLERGDLSSSGGAVYARGHVRSIAAVLGVDPAPLLAAFPSADASAPLPVPSPEPLRASRVGSLQVPRAQDPERRAPRWGVAVVAATAVLVGLLAVGVLTGGSDRSPGRADDVLAGPVPTTTSRRAAPKPIATDAQAAVPPASGARLRVRAVTGSSWVRVQGTSGTLFEGVLTEGGAVKDFRDAKELRLLVGNAGALSLVCGSKDLSPAGGQGKVLRFTCRQDGLVPS